MRHSNSGKKFSRTPSHRKALLRNLAKALLSHGRIRTTEVKAKELRGVVEPLITLALRNDLHARRLAYRTLCSHALVKRLFDEIAPVFAGVPGGYTRVVKLAKARRGDNAPLAVIELTRGAHVEQVTETKKAPKVARVSQTASAPDPAAPAEAEAVKPKRPRKKAEPAPETA
jgi:large subunit ribosomal protein L17